MSARSGSIALIHSDAVTNADQRIPSLPLGTLVKNGEREREREKGKKNQCAMMGRKE